jgi:hypothetical protein
MHNDQSQDSRDTQRYANFLEFMMGAWVVSIEVFIRRFFGENYIGFKGPAVLFLVPFFSLFWQHYDIWPLVQFMGVFLCMCVAARAGTANRKRNGFHMHSKYSGQPLLSLLLPGVSEIRVKQYVEPLFVAAVGYVTREFNEPLGWYLILGAVCMSCSMKINSMYWDRRVGDLNDAVIEQQYVAERFREMRGENF